MHPRTIVALAGLLAVTAGCAGARHSQELGRMKSDMGLLDQRVSQLERTGVTPPTGSLWPSDGAIQPVNPSASLSSDFSSAPASISKPSKKQIQQALKNAGFYQGAIDGRIGPKTRAAIQEFQKANGLKADGVAGSKTWSKLSPYADISGATTASLTEPVNK